MSMDDDNYLSSTDSSARLPQYHIKNVSQSSALLFISIKKTIKSYVVF